MRWALVLMNEFAGGDAGGGGGGTAPAGSGAGSSSSSAGSGSSGGESRQAVPGASPANDPAGGAATASADAKAAAAKAAAKYKLKRDGKEFEHTGEELVKMLGDDYEHEFRGAGGEPLKLNRRELARAVQRSHGFEQKMRDLSGREKAFADDQSWAMEKGQEWTDDMGEKHFEFPNLLSFLETRLGVPNAEAWAMRLYSNALAKQNEIAQLEAKGERQKAWRLLQQMVKSQSDRKEARDKMLAKRAEEQKARQAHEEKLGRLYTDALKEAGLPTDKRALGVVRRIMQENAELGIKLSKQDAMDLARKEIYGTHRSFISSMPREQLLAFLGDDLRGLVRELETEALRGKKNEERREQRAEERATNGGAQNGKKGGGMTEAQLKAKHGWT